MPKFLAAEEVRNGTLVQILKAWNSEEIPIYFIYSSQKYLTNKVRNFIDFAKAELNVITKS